MFLATPALQILHNTDSCKVHKRTGPSQPYGCSVSPNCRVHTAPSLNARGEGLEIALFFAQLSLPIRFGLGAAVCQLLVHARDIVKIGVEGMGSMRILARTSIS